MGAKGREVSQRAKVRKFRLVPGVEAPRLSAEALTGVRLRATVLRVRIRNFVHKGLKKLYLEDSAKGLPPDAVDKLRGILAFLQEMQDPETLRVFPL